MSPKPMYSVGRNSEGYCVRRSTDGKTIVVTLDECEAHIPLKRVAMWTESSYRLRAIEIAARADAAAWGKGLLTK